MAMQAQGRAEILSAAFQVGHGRAQLGQGPLLSLDLAGLGRHRLVEGGQAAPDLFERGHLLDLD